MSLFKQLLADLKDAAGEISTTLKTDLTDASGLVRDEVDTTSAAISIAIAEQLADWDETVRDHHDDIDDTVHQILTSAYQIDRGVFAHRAERVLARLHQARADRPPVELVVLHWGEPNAMVLFSHRIYLSTALLDALPDDDALAFVLGHEITHIDQGDIRVDGTLRLPPLPPMLPLRLSLGMLARIWMRPEMERGADAGGQALAVAAGYRSDGFEQVFDVLSAHATEGLEADPSQWSEFWRQKASGYPSLAERRTLLQAHCAISP